MGSKPRSSKSKIYKSSSLAKLLAKLRKARGKKPRVVFTNGCFDLLHPGHVDYLQRARKLGDLLVVALNADESVRKLKGPTRPINALADRQVVMAGLECVDFVTSFEEDTPLELMLLLKPSLIVKGGDWKVEQMVGSKEAREWGGKARSLAFVEGKSTTAIVEKMKK